MLNDFNWPHAPLDYSKGARLLAHREYSGEISLRYSLFDTESDLGYPHAAWTGEKPWLLHVPGYQHTVELHTKLKGLALLLLGYLDLACEHFHKTRSVLLGDLKNNLDLDIDEDLVMRIGALSHTPELQAIEVLGFFEEQPDLLEKHEYQELFQRLLFTAPCLETL